MEHSYCLVPKETVDSNRLGCNSNQCGEVISTQDILSYCLNVANDIALEREQFPAQRSLQLDYLLNIIRSSYFEAITRDGKNRKQKFTSESEIPTAVHRPVLVSDTLRMISLSEKQKLEGYFIFLDRSLDLVRNKCKGHFRVTSECHDKVDEQWCHFLSPLERETVAALAIGESWTEVSVDTELSDDLYDVQPMAVDSFAKIVAAMLSATTYESQPEVEMDKTCALAGSDSLCHCPTTRPCSASLHSCFCVQQHRNQEAMDIDNLFNDEDQFCKLFSMENYLDFQDGVDDDDDENEPISDRSFEE